jgi:ferrous-iron efflux pump FieF
MIDREDSRLMRRAAYASVTVAAALVGLKAFAYLASNSVAMLASLADSALDLFTAALNLFAIHTALSPADDEHRFGHGKAEPLAGLAQGAFITASALFLLVEGVQRLIAPAPIDNSVPALLVMAVSIAAAIGLILYQRHVVARTASLAIEADKTHYFGDLVTNVGVILAIGLSSYLGWTLADPLIGMAVAGVMLVSAWRVADVALDQLMDRELPDEDRASIVRIAQAHGAVRGVHDLKTRMAGRSIFIQLHLVLDNAMALGEAHAISDAVEAAIANAFPGADVIIHQDPDNLSEPGATAA